jgi:hypothetical protein
MRQKGRQKKTYDFADRFIFSSPLRLLPWGIFLLIFCLFITSRIALSFRAEDKNQVLSKRVDNFIAKVSPEDQLFLEYFFRNSFLQDSFGYVLCNVKPMAIHTCLLAKPLLKMKNRKNPISQMRFFFSHIKRQELLYNKSIEIWKKYESYLGLKNFKFQYWDSYDPLSGAVWRNVALLNKSLLADLIQKEPKEFCQFRYVHENTDKLIDRLANDTALLEKISCDDALLGLCLGYGKKNAQFFAKMAEIMKKIGKHKFSLEVHNPERLEQLSYELSEIEKRLGYSNYKSFSDLELVSSIGFRCDFSDKETLTLLKTYNKAKKRLTKHFAGNFFKEALFLMFEADQEMTAQNKPR